MKKMKNLLKLEELGQFLLSIMLFCRLEYSWCVFPACVLLLDLSLIDYLICSKISAWMYNFFHHKLVAFLVLLLGFWLNEPLITLAGVILFGHSAMDQIFRYGLKFNDHLQNTHLRWIGKNKE